MNSRKAEHHKHCKDQKDSMYAQFDRDLGFDKVPKVKKAKVKLPEKAEICNTCSWRKFWCWNSNLRRGILKNNNCGNYKLDEVEAKRLEELTKQIRNNKSGGSGTLNG